MSQVYNPYGSAVGDKIPPSTTTTTTCTPSFQAIELQAGQSFILPPGATLISATDIGAIQSDCADLSKLETPVCYSVDFAGSEGGEDSAQNWQYSSFFIDGLLINNQFFGFGAVNDPPSNFGPSVVPAVNNIFPGLFTCWNGQIFNQGEQSSGWTYKVFYKTIPSIGDNLFWRGFTTKQWQSPNFDTYIYAKGVRANSGCSC